MPNRTTPAIPTPSKPEYFDYTIAASQAGIAPDQLRTVIARFERDYPHDLMLRELHILRACNAVLRGAVTVQSLVGADKAA